MLGETGIILDFEVPRSALEEARAVGASSLPAGVLEETVLELPVRIVVGGAELRGPVHPTSIIYAAKAGLSLLRNLSGNATAKLFLSGGGTLVFCRLDEHVVVEEGVKRVSGTARYAALVQAWEAFDRRVRAVLLDEFPEFREHPELGAWFRGEE